MNIACTLALAACLFTGTARADLQEGLAAYQAGDFATALDEFMTAASSGDAKAQNAIGIMYEYGQGVAPDASEAVAWYRKAALQGLAQAQHDLARMCSLGQGVAQDLPEALRWYRQAAQQGHAISLHQLGSLYQAGRGLARDLVLAYAHFSLAAAAGHPEALRQRGKLATQLTRAQQEQGERLAAHWTPHTELPTTAVTEVATLRSLQVPARPPSD